MNLFNITDVPDQQFGTIINNQRVTIRVRYNASNDRWTFDLSLDDEAVLHGRRIVAGVDLLAAFDFGLGLIFAYSASDSAPDRDALPNGTVQLYNATLEELEAVL